MSTYSIRCCNSKCRHRRVARIHPLDYRLVPKCDVCGKRVGWRIEQRYYNSRGLCYCGGPVNRNGMSYPHRSTHPLCDLHPLGYYHQAKRAGICDGDIPAEFLPTQLH